MSSRANVRGGVNTQQQQMDVNAERTAVICAALKSLYAKYVLPLEKKYQYDYFFESPFLSDVEFDGKNSFALEGETSGPKRAPPVVNYYSAN
jgi:hypothetical protein